MKIKVITVGKIKENFFRDAILEYSKRISKFASLEIIELQDEKTPDKASESENIKILQKEGNRIKEAIKPGEYVISLAIEGKRYDSISFSDKISDICLKGHNCIDFVIGGSLGIYDEIKKMSNELISFSDMTFPHQLMRVILLEQVYRAFKIQNNEPYHK